MLITTCWSNKSVLSSVGLIPSTVVPECCKDDYQSQWENMKFDPPTTQPSCKISLLRVQGFLTPIYVKLSLLGFFFHFFVCGFFRQASAETSSACILGNRLKGRTRNNLSETFTVGLQPTAMICDCSLMVR